MVTAPNGANWHRQAAAASRGGWPGERAGANSSSASTSEIRRDAGKEDPGFDASPFGRGDDESQQAEKGGRGARPRRTEAIPAPPTRAQNARTSASTLSWVHLMAAPLWERAGGLGTRSLRSLWRRRCRDDAGRGDAETVGRGLGVADRQRGAAGGPIEGGVLGGAIPGETDEGVTALRAADERSTKAGPSPGIGSLTTRLRVGAGGTASARRTQVAEVDARLGGDGRGVMAPSRARGASAGQGPVQKQGATTYRPAART